MRDAIDRAVLNNQRRRAELNDFVSRSQGSQTSRIGSNLGAIFKRRRLDRELAELQPQLDARNRQRHSSMVNAIAQATGQSPELLNQLPIEDLTGLAKGFAQQQTKAKERKILKDVGGFQRFQDTGERVFPDAQQQTKAKFVPSAIQEFNFFQKLNPTERQEYLNVKRSDPLRAKGLVEDAEGGVAPIEGVEESISKVEKAKATGKKTGELDTIKFKKEFPKARAALQSFERSTGVVNREIERVQPLLNQLTAGFAGTPLSKIPGTEAKNVTRLLDTIRANLGFNQLQEMRDNSPTGGALGQVSELENRLLQATEGSLDQDQTPEQLIETLGFVQGSIFDIAEQKRGDFMFDYADILGVERPDALPEQKVTRPQQEEGVVDALPQGAKQIGFEKSTGKPVFETPDGKRFIQE